MNPLKHIVHSLPRHAAPSNAISAVSSGYQINAQSFFRHGSDFLRVDLPSNRPSPSQSFTGYGQTLLLGKPKIALTCSRNASIDRVGHPNIPIDSKKSDDSKKITKAEVPNKNEKQAPQLTANPEPRNYAKLIADYSEAMEKQSLQSKNKELPTGLLSRLPIDSIVSSLSPFEKNPKFFKSKLKKRVAKLNTKQSNHEIAKTSLKTENEKSATMTSASQKRDYFTKNCDAENNSQSTSSVLMENAYTPNDFDIICDLTNEEKNSRSGERSNFGDIAGHKVKDPSNLVDVPELSDPTLNNNHCQFNIVASEEKIELKLSSVISRQPDSSGLIAADQTSMSSTPIETKIMKNIPMAQKLTYKYNPKKNPLPWWTTPDSILNKKYEKAERTSSYSTPEIQVIYSEEMSNVEISKTDEKAPSSLHNSKFKQQEKLANLSKTKQYIKEELEKHKSKQRRKRINQQTSIDGKEVEEGKMRPMNERLDDKTARLSKMIDREIETRGQHVVAETSTNIPVFEAMNKKSKSQNNANALPEASKMQQKEARKRSIDQEYRMKKVTEPLKPLEKKKDGTLIDYGLKVPTRRPKNKQPVTGERNPEKKNSAPHHHHQQQQQHEQQVDRKSECSIPRQITSSSQQQLLTFGKSDENGKNNNLDLRRSNYSGEAIAQRLVNSLQQQHQQSRSEQMFRPRRDSCHSNCRLSICAADSTIISVCEQERPEKQLIYSAWLNRSHTPRRFLL